MSSSRRFSDCALAFVGELDGIHRALRRFGFSRADAEDLAQEVFLVMWRRWADYDPHRPLRPWVLGIAFRVAQDHRRRLHREIPAGLIEIEDQGPEPDHRVATERARALVRAALGALPEKQRVVMILHDLDGIPMQDIAGTFSEPLTTLYSRLVSARRSFARAIRRLERRHLVWLAPAGAPSGALLEVEGTPNPLSPAARARLLQRVRDVELASSAPGAPPATTRSTRLALQASGGTVVALAALILLLWSRPSADARPAGPSGEDSARDQRPSGGLRGSLVRRTPEPPAWSAPLPAEPAGSARLEQGLVGYWRFDEGAGSPAARDLSGNTTDCQMRGLDPDSQWVAGRQGGAIQLDGKGWLECPHPRFGRSANLTVAAWVKRTQAQRGMRVLATRQIGSGVRDHFFFGFVGDDFSFTSHVWNGPLRHPVAAGLDRWVHLAAVHRDGQVRLFVDGEAVAQRSSYRGRTVETASALLIGGGNNGPDPAVTTQRLVATLDELLVYDRPLGNEEIAALAGGAQPRLSR